VRSRARAYRDIRHADGVMVMFAPKRTPIQKQQQQQQQQNKAINK
jgi:hypothetical protein